MKKKLRFFSGIASLSLLALVAVFLMREPQAFHAAQRAPGGSALPGSLGSPEDAPDFSVSAPITPTLSPAARDLPPYEPEYLLDREINPRLNLTGNLLDFDAPAATDALLASQAQARAVALDTGFQTPLLNIAGQGYTAVQPPDTVGDVGPNHYIQMINGSGGAAFVIYDKAGNIVKGQTLLEGLGIGACASGYGDPIVLYDQLADRWLMSEFARTGNHLCVYVSTSPDPTGTYHRYDFPTPDFPDYPKYAVWPDAYYVTSNESSPTVYALDRAAMLSGAAAASQRFTAPALSGFGFQALTPADLDGAAAPPAGAPNYMLRQRDTEIHGPNGHPADDIIEVWAFHVDWVTPANSTFTKITDVLVAEFDSTLCGTSSFYCFPQPGTTTLDPLREVIMWRLQYRNFGNHETLVGNFVTDVDGTNHGGVRWFELRKTDANPWGLFQEGTYAPDSYHRWMGAIAMDGDGNIALGYNVSSSSLSPSLRYVGRLAGDPRGTLPQGEVTLIAGGGSNTSNRYGDYAAMSVDPADDCTFWFTGEYNPSSLWGTRIGAFKFGTCSWLNAAPTSQEVCVPQDAVYAVTVGQIDGYTGTVHLELSSPPAGASVGFSANDLAAPYTSTLTLSNTAAMSLGSYPLAIAGSGLTQTRTANVILILNKVPTVLPTLLSPTVGAQNVALQPQLNWSSVNRASAYRLEIASDAAFDDIVYSVDTAETSHTLTTSLAPFTSYFWRVTPKNACGDGAPSAVAAFTTLLAAVELSADQAQSGAPGETLTYTLALTNSGSATDLFTLTLSGAAWPTALSAANFSLAAGASASITVTVAILASAPRDASDTASLVAVSRNDSKVTVALQLTSTAAWIDYRLLLPLVQR